MIFSHYTIGKITKNLLEAKFDGKDVCFHVKSVERDFAFELEDHFKHHACALDRFESMELVFVDS